VTVVRAGRPVLDEVTASIPAAGSTVVSGPSGADKTMLLIRLSTPDHRLIHLPAPADH
jgi:KaiC/GvpD/RAD55 family RecA-like ATPase